MKEYIYEWYQVIPHLLNKRSSPLTIGLTDTNQDLNQWTCKNGHVLNRDLDAAKNILKEGLKIYGQGLSITNDGAEIRLWQRSTRYETRSQSHRL